MSASGSAVTVPGSIIANPGFVAVFGTVVTHGKISHDPQPVGPWGGIQSGGQIIGMWGSPFLSDRFGQKKRHGTSLLHAPSSMPLLFVRAYPS